MNNRSMLVAFLICLAIPVNVSAAPTPPWEARPAQRNTVTLDFLLETCDAVGKTARGMIPYFDCDSYIYGVLDAYLEVRDRLPFEKRACFPASITPGQVLKDIWHLASQNDDRLSRTAAPTIIEELRKKYPCSKNK